LSIGGLLVLTGLGIGQNSFEHLLDPTVPTQLATIAAVVSILVKEFLYQVTAQIGKRQNSQVLIANAWHHRSDAISSILALIGIVGAQLGIRILDPIAGLLVCGLIVKLGFSTIMASIRDLTDTVEDLGLIKEIQNIASKIEGVDSSSQIRTRKMGPHTLVDMQVQVDPMMSVSAGHQVAERVRLTILNHFPEISEVLIHVNAEPEQEAGTEKLMRPQKEIQEDVKQILKGIPSIKETSHILCHYLNRKLHVEVTISVDENLRVKEAQEIAKKARDSVEKINNVSACDVHLELLSSHQIHEEIRKNNK